ncbi:uncharacterized protein SETTUDRAFT_35429 [Exserohilum turcica Et28A]|uniref:Uncharacterized protein n=1 Tax=Exserohilum turcicum (strain 28A) TaxID=671987 RepID=R0JVU1_EXST2|nr:uncharacterized protein SETTUDRAFT_35429 [Exserohilum turcica Et28A]EOA81599.1 hypothetical protein SETTUDRAFT_35429 [Exserohilum turcica Et28A]
MWLSTRAPFPSSPGPSPILFIKTATRKNSKPALSNSQTSSLKTSRAPVNSHTRVFHSPLSRPTRRRLGRRYPNRFLHARRAVAGVADTQGEEKAKDKAEKKGHQKVKVGGKADEYEDEGLSGGGDDKDQQHKSNWREDVGGILLDFARLYNFAERYLIQGLKEQVMRILRG